MEKKRIVFMGTPDIAARVLEYLHATNAYEIALVVTNEAKRVGRKGIMTECATELKAKELGLSARGIAKITEELIDEIKALRPEFIIVVAFGHMLPSYFCDEAIALNLHGSLLPKYRGASPMQAQILNDEQEMGVTVIKIAKKMDSGVMYGQASYTRGAGEYLDIEQLTAKCIVLGGALLHKVMQDFSSIKPVTQDTANVTFCKKIAKVDGQVAFEDAKEVYLKYLAYKLWPTIYIQSPSGNLRLDEVKLFESKTDSNNFRAGEILEIKRESVVVSCTSGALELFSITRAGKKSVNAAQFVKNARLGVGSLLL